MKIERDSTHARRNGLQITGLFPVREPIPGPVFPVSLFRSAPLPSLMFPLLMFPLSTSQASALSSGRAVSSSVLRPSKRLRRDWRLRR